MLTQERLKQLLYYDPDTGLFWRLTNLSRGFKAGTVAGSIAKPTRWKRGAYTRISVDNVLYRAHRLASRVEAGYIWVNGASTHHVGVPFGGVKQSGIGREESIEELLACTQIKNVNVTLRTQSHKG